MNGDQSRDENKILQQTNSIEKKLLEWKIGGGDPFNPKGKGGPPPPLLNLVDAKSLSKVLELLADQGRRRRESTFYFKTSNHIA